jgi:hypothetical protein
MPRRGRWPRLRPSLGPSRRQRHKCARQATLVTFQEKPELCCRLAIGAVFEVLAQRWALPKPGRGGLVAGRQRCSWSGCPRQSLRAGLREPRARPWVHPLGLEGREFLRGRATRSSQVGWVKSFIVVECDMGQGDDRANRCQADRRLSQLICRRELRASQCCRRWKQTVSRRGLSPVRISPRTAKRHGRRRWPVVSPGSMAVAMS